MTKDRLEDVALTILIAALTLGAVSLCGAVAVAVLWSASK